MADEVAEGSGFQFETLLLGHRLKHPADVAAVDG
jgi:hypothetical protein